MHKQRHNVRLFVDSEDVFWDSSHSFQEYSIHVMNSSIVEALQCIYKY